MRLFDNMNITKSIDFSYPRRTFVSRTWKINCFLWRLDLVHEDSAWKAVETSKNRNESSSRIRSFDWWNFIWDFQCLIGF